MSSNIDITIMSTVKEGFGAMLLINIRDLNIEYGLFLISCTQAIDLA